MQQLPPNPPAPVARLVDEHAKLTSANRDAAAALAASLDALVAAEATDRDAYATALREGKPDPGSPASDAARQDVDDAERRTAATEQALAQVGVELDAAVQKHSATWTRLVAERRTAEIARARAAADQLAAGIETIRVLCGTSAWLADASTRRYRPGRAVARQVLPNGEPMPLDALVAELAGWLDALAEPEPEPEPVGAGKVATAT